MEHLDKNSWVFFQNFKTSQHVSVNEAALWSLELLNNSVVEQSVNSVLYYTKQRNTQFITSLNFGERDVMLKQSNTQL